MHHASRRRLFGRHLQQGSGFRGESLEERALLATFQGIGDLAGGDIYSAASAVSGDGSVVVGASAAAGGREAFRWTKADGIVALGSLTSTAFANSAENVSFDGSVIVGVASVDDFGQEGFRWTADTKMVGLWAP
jgi:probable HAF family extracellular repeat protein